jgi:hypothetical protein
VEAHPPWKPPVIVCDVSRIAVPDASMLDVLLRLQLTASRLGATVELHNACAVLVDLIALTGLSDVLVVAGPDPNPPDRAGSRVEVHGQIEEREQRGIDEEVLGGDLPA